MACVIFLSSIAVCISFTCRRTRIGFHLLKNTLKREETGSYLQNHNKLLLNSFEKKKNVCFRTTRPRTGTDLKYTGF